MSEELVMSPFDWVVCDDDLDYPVIVEWGNGTKGFLVADHKGRRKDVWKYIEGYPAYICDLSDMIMIGEFGGMYNQVTVYIIDHIDPDRNEIIAVPWYSKTNNRVAIGKESKFTNAITNILHNRANDTARRSIYYGLEPRR